MRRYNSNLKKNIQNNNRNWKTETKNHNKIQSEKKQQSDGVKTIAANKQRLRNAAQNVCSPKNTKLSDVSFIQQRRQSNL